MVMFQRIGALGTITADTVRLPLFNLNYLTSTEALDVYHYTSSYPRRGVLGCIAIFVIKAFRSIRWRRLIAIEGRGKILFAAETHKLFSAFGPAFAQREPNRKLLLDLDKPPGRDYALIYLVFAKTGAAPVRVPDVRLGRVTALIISFIAASDTHGAVSFPLVNRVLAQRRIRIRLSIIAVGPIHRLFALADWWVLSGRVGAGALGHNMQASTPLNSLALLPNAIPLQRYLRMAFTQPASCGAKSPRNLASRPLLYTFTADSPIVKLLVFAPSLIIRTCVLKSAPGIPAVLVRILFPAISFASDGHDGILQVRDWHIWYTKVIQTANLAHIYISLHFISRYQQVGVAIGAFVAFGVLAPLQALLGRPSLRRAVSWNT